VGGTMWAPSMNIGSYSLTNRGACDFLIIKYDPAGRVLNAFNDGGPWKDELTAITCDNKGNIYLCGDFWGDSIKFGNFALKNSNNLSTDLFIVKYNSFGKFVWAKKTGSISLDYIYSIFSDDLANIYASGAFYEKSITFDTIRKYIYIPTLQPVFL
jgi:hypothetical protein